MNSRSYAQALGWLACLVMVVASCGEPAPEKLLDKSRKIDELYKFGTLYVPLYKQAVADSDWTAIRQNIRDIIRLKERKEADTKEFDAKKTEIHQKLLQQKKYSTFSTYLSELKKRSKITVQDKFIQ